MRERATLAVGRREVYAMLIGAILYGGLSWLTNIFQLQAAPDLQIRPGVAVPILFGFVYGPIVGFVTGAVGNFVGDLASGLLPYAAVQPIGNVPLDLLRSYLLNWQVGNGLMGLIPGLWAMYRRRYVTFADHLRALGFTALGIVTGMAFSSFTHPLVDLTVNLDVALRDYFIPIARVNLVNAAILMPILLFNYEHLDLRSTAWVRSGLMRRLSMAILISAALPVALLGLFLTQQTTGVAAGSTELTVKLGFTVVLTLIFTVANAALLAQNMSRPLLRLTEAAQLMEAGELTSAQAAELGAEGARDEISRLSHMFGRMAREVILREETLRREVEKLRIQIDQAKKVRQVAEITESDYFRHLRKKAKEIRNRERKARS